MDTNPAMETRESKEFSAIGIRIEDPSERERKRGGVEFSGGEGWFWFFFFVRVLGEEVLLVC